MRRQICVLRAVLWAALSALAPAAAAEESISFFEQATLAPGRGANAWGFGTAVALEGDTLVITSTVDDNDRGSAFVLDRNLGGSGAWGVVAKLIAPDFGGGDTFGGAVDLSGDTLVIGAAKGDGREEDSGAVYVFERDSGGEGAWGFSAKITAADGQEVDEFGKSVAVDGDTILVGSERHAAGSAYVFERDPRSGVWVQGAKLVGNGGSFGYAVALAGDTAIVGAYTEALTGVAYVYERDHGGPEAWGEVARLIAPDGGELDYFGYSVSIAGDRAVVGAERAPANIGAVYIYERDEGGADQWGLVTKLVASDARSSDYFGTAVAQDRDAILIGANEVHAGGLSNSGAAYVFLRDHPEPGAWGQVAKLTAGEPAERGFMGSSVAIEGETLVAGAHGTPGHGAVHVFQKIVVDPELTVSGVCPGSIELTSEGATPLGEAELWIASSAGTTILESGPCTGTALPLFEADLLRSDRSDSEGRRAIVRDAPEHRCGAHLALLDKTSCAVSEALQTP